MTTDEILEHTKYIDSNGKVLDEFGNEFKDEYGKIVYVNEEDWEYFELLS